MRHAHTILPILAVLSGCGGAGAGQPTTPQRPVTAAESAKQRDAADSGDTAWGRRDDVNQLRRAIEVWNDRVARQPSDTATWIRLAEAHHVASTHPTVTTADARLDAVQGQGAARRALSILSPEVASAFDAGRVPETIETPEATGAFYWYLRNEWRVAVIDGYAAMLLTAPAYTAGMETCARLASALDHHGPLVALAEQHCAPVEPRLRDTALGRSLFERAIDAEPSHLPHQVGLAQHCAVHARDRELFQRSLAVVVGATVDDDALDNLLAQRRARQLLEHADDWFE